MVAGLVVYVRDDLFGVAVVAGSMMALQVKVILIRESMV